MRVVLLIACKCANVLSLSLFLCTATGGAQGRDAQQPVREQTRTRRSEAGARARAGRLPAAPPTRCFIKCCVRMVLLEVPMRPCLPRPDAWPGSGCRAFASSFSSPRLRFLRSGQGQVRVVG